MPRLSSDELAHWGESRQAEIVATSVLFLVLCNLSVALRISAQLRLSRRLFVEDYAILVALACCNLTSALYLVSTHNGLGLHLYRVFGEDPHPPQRLVTLFRSLYINAVVTGPYFFAIKVSLLFYYRRTFLVNQKWLKRAWWVNLVYVILWTIGTTVYYILQCIPPNYYWNRLYPMFDIPTPQPIHGQCKSSTATLIAIPLILSLVSDIGILLLPVITLSRLRLRLRRKLGLICLFSLGFLACLCEIARIWLETRSSPTASDPTYDDVAFVIFTFAEGSIAIVAACGPLVASQWKWSVQKVKSVYGSRSQSQKSEFTSPSETQVANKHSDLLHTERKTAFTASGDEYTRSDSQRDILVTREFNVQSLNGNAGPPADPQF